VTEQSFEDRPEVREALVDDTTVAGLALENTPSPPDPDTPQFQEPGEPALLPGKDN
jgi:hypothetical protein